MKKVLILMTFMVLMTGSLNAQVFDTGDNSESNRAQTDGIVLTAQQSEEQDRFTPLGSGTLILAALGGTYLWSRKKNGQINQSFDQL